MITFLITVGWMVAALLAGAGFLHLVPKLGSAGRRLTAWLAIAPGLDLVVTYFTAAPLIVGPIDIGEDAFIGARAFIMPGVTIGEGAVVGAAAVAVRDAKPWTVIVGNPGNQIAMRKFDRPGADAGTEG